VRPERAADVGLPPQPRPGRIGWHIGGTGGGKVSTGIARPAAGQEAVTEECAVSDEATRTGATRTGATTGETTAGKTRRRGFGTGMKLALAAPMALGMAPAVAAADEGNGREQGRPAWQRLQAQRERRQARRPFARPWSAQHLCRLADVSGDDFDKWNATASQDALRRGVLFVSRGQDDTSGRVFLVLAGAAPGATYEVFFVRARNMRERERIGQVTTNGDGDFRGLVRTGAGNSGDPGRLGGSRRVGLFAVTRDGKDQFVTCFPTQ
jgi:hypothetical protein